MGINSFSTMSNASLLEARSATCKRDTGQWSALLWNWNCRTMWYAGPAGLAQPQWWPCQVPMWFCMRFCARYPGAPASCKYGTELAASGTAATCALCSELCPSGKNNSNLKPCGVQFRYCLHLTTDHLSYISCPQGISVSLAIKEKLGLCGFIKW